MLKLDGISPVTDASVEFDGYIPFNIEFPSVSSSTPYYWRRGDGKYSLLELGINPGLKAIESVTLAMINGRDVKYVDQTTLPTLPELEGLPNCDVIPWMKADWVEESPTTLDEFDTDIHVEIGDEFITTFVDEQHTACRYFHNHPVVFGVASTGILVSISIMNISKRDLDSMDNAIALL